MAGNPRITGSNSAIKAEGIRLAFSELFPNTEINVIGSTAPSLINEQPIGYSEGELGVRNRLRGALQQAVANKIDWDYLVVIESYLTPANGLFNVDTALILIKDKEDNTSTFKSESLALGNGEPVIYDPKTTTLAEALIPFIDSKDYNPKDPHLYFGGKSRSKYIAEAIVNHYYNGVVL
jgi:hypothetical protein